jgi:hypothetical protein
MLPFCLFETMLLVLALLQQYGVLRRPMQHSMSTSRTEAQHVPVRHPKPGTQTRKRTAANVEVDPHANPTQPTDGRTADAQVKNTRPTCTSDQLEFDSCGASLLSSFFVVTRWAGQGNPANHVALYSLRFKI